MKIAIEIEPAAFEVPQCIKADLSELEYEFVLSDIPAEALAALCDEFRANVFKAAGKEAPPEVRPVSQRAAALGCMLDARKVIDAVFTGIKVGSGQAALLSQLDDLVTQTVKYLKA